MNTQSSVQSWAIAFRLFCTSRSPNTSWRLRLMRVSIVSGTALSYGVSVGHPHGSARSNPRFRVGVSAPDFVGVEQLRFPRDRRTGGARAFGENLAEVSEILGARPIALKFSGHRQPSDRLGARRYEAADAHVVCLHRHTAGGIRHDVDVVSLPHRLDGRHRQAHFRPEGSEHDL